MDPDVCPPEIRRSRRADRRSSICAATAMRSASTTAPRKAGSMSARDSDTANGLVAAALAVMLCACAHSPIDPRERLAWYRENAGRPVAGFDYVRNMRWEALGDQALAVWPRRDAGFLLEMASPCPGL